MASTRIYRTAGTPTSTKKFTISFWCKKTTEGTDQFIFSSFTDANNRFQIQFNTDDQLDFICKVSGSNVVRLKTTRKFRDPSAWYHIVAVLDTTESTNSDRIKFYINGERELAAGNGFASETYPSQNADVNVSGTHTVGAYHDGGSPTLYFSGDLTHVNFTDGYTYQASTFGETNSTSGIWVPKTAPSVTYGTNGFFLKFENSGNLDLDSSSNNLSFTTAGTLTQNVDTPTNNLSTLNPLDNPYVGQAATYSNANTVGQSTTTGFLSGSSTIGASSGKWYAEFKLTAGDMSLSAMGVIGGQVDDLHQTALHDYTKFYGVRGNGSKYQPGGSGTSSWASSYTTNDIISLAMDLDNNRLYVAKNGQYADGSGNYDEAFTGSPAYITLASDLVYHFVGGSISTGSGVFLTMQSNFGTGFFGTTAVASANADANGHGAFEYAVPSGYYALNTKNLKEFG